MPGSVKWSAGDSIHLDRGSLSARGVCRMTRLWSGSEAALAARAVLGSPRLVETVGDLATLAARLPQEMPLLIDDVVRIDGAAHEEPGEEACTGVVADLVLVAGPRATPIRDDRGREHDVLDPALQLGARVLPASGAPIPKRPARPTYMTMRRNPSTRARSVPASPSWGGR